MEERDKKVDKKVEKRRERHIKIFGIIFLVWVFYRYVEVGGLWGAIVGGFFIYLIVTGYH